MFRTLLIATSIYVFSFHLIASEEEAKEEFFRAQALDFIRYGNVAQLATSGTELWLRALREFDVEVMQAILDRRVVPLKDLASDPFLLHFAWRESSSMPIATREKVIDLYLQVANLNELDALGRHILAYARSADEMRFLINKGADILLVDREHLVPALHAFYDEELEKLQFPDEVWEKIPVCFHCEKKLSNRAVKWLHTGKECQNHIECVHAILAEAEEEE